MKAILEHDTCRQLFCWVDCGAEQKQWKTFSLVWKFGTYMASGVAGLEPRSLWIRIFLNSLGFADQRTGCSSIWDISSVLHTLRVEIKQRENSVQGDGDLAHLGNLPAIGQCVINFWNLLSQNVVMTFRSGMGKLFGRRPHLFDTVSGGG